MTNWKLSFVVLLWILSCWLLTIFRPRSEYSELAEDECEYMINIVYPVYCLQCFHAVGRKGIRPVKTEWWGAGMVVCLERLSFWSEVQTCIWPSWCHCHPLSLASVKSRLVLPFWYQLTWVVPDKGPLNGYVCVCVVYPVFYVDSTSTVEENSSVFSVIWMHWLPPARVCGQ